MKGGERVLLEKRYVHIEGSEEEAAMVSRNSPKIWKCVCFTVYPFDWD